ncbi:MAG: hypothetical protein JWQ40_3167 [Segetibacter sp.]|nr:hypothetical protein [Segetibacter sp.]
MQGKTHFIKLLLGVLVCFSTHSIANNNKKRKVQNSPASKEISYSARSPNMKLLADSLYEVIDLANYGMEKSTFFNAYKGYRYLQNKGSVRKKNLLTICDYSQSINNKRLYVIDLVNLKVLFNTYVAHGIKSGDECASSFSNLENSNKSCLGFLITADTYNGDAGYSMRFNGMEHGINDRARSRAIVLHGSIVLSEPKKSSQETIIKSLGCPAVPYGIHSKIIDAIKGGSCFFINHPDKKYAKTSAIVNAQFDLAPIAKAE